VFHKSRDDTNDRSREALARADSPRRLKPAAQIVAGFVKQGTSLEDALTTLHEIFHQALDEMLDSVQTAIQVPELSPWNSGGVAYNKFLAIYNGMLDGASGDLDYVG